MENNHPIKKNPGRDISGPWIEVDLNAVTRNIRQIKKKTGGLIMPVIKANAYGHGIVEIGRHLESLDVEGLCVGKFQEAHALREGGVACPVLNLGIFSKTEADIILLNNISQAVFDDRAVLLNERAGRMKTQAKVHIKIDTGLGRIGVHHTKAMDFIRRINAMAHITIEGVYTSLTEDPDFDAIQIQRFRTICSQAATERISLNLRHCASSAGILSSPHGFFDMVRPGIMVFGCYPSHDAYKNRRIDLIPALSLKAKAGFVKKIDRGEAVSYHQAYRARERETIVTGAIGYSDGYPTGLAEKGFVLLHGKRFPLIASVTANHIYIKAGDDDTIKTGDEIVLIGRQGDKTIPVETLSDLSGLSDYQLLSSLNPLVPRIYV